jgi:hypothetical protein
MKKVKELISNLLEESLLGRVNILESRFSREASDLSYIEVEIEGLKSKQKF